MLDCCDREVIAFTAVAGFLNGDDIRDMMLAAVARRFGDHARKLPKAIEWLTDNGSVYTAHDTVEQAEALGFVVCTTPPYSPESNGMAGAFVKGFKRDYAYLADVRTAEELIAQLPSWFDGYNRVRPHKGLKLLSPMEYREINLASCSVRFSRGNSTIVGTCVSHGINPRAYLHLVTKLIVERWPRSKLRELLPDRIGFAHADLVIRSGPFRSPILGLETPTRELTKV